MIHSGYVYIISSCKNGTLYIGVTSDLKRRIWQHKNNEIAGFTRRYGIKTLVYYEVLRSMNDAISREKQMKKWKRAWKIELIEKENPEWKDLFEEIV